MNLIEKLQARRDQFNSFSRHEVFDKNDLADAVQTCIDIVKQHSDWVPVKEKPTQRGTYLVYTTDGSVFDCRYSQDCWHKSTIGYRDILYWQPLPQPPSEVQDGK